MSNVILFFLALKNFLSRFGLLFLASRHLIVSSICGFSEYCIFIILYSFVHLPLISSYVLAFFIATTIGYVGHIFYTFQLRSFSMRTILLFGFQALVVLIIGIYVLKMLVYIGIYIYLAKAIQLCMTFFINFNFGRFYSFKKV